ncbi:MAG: DUF6596 domain-containing protein [Bacteroidota bacterium]
MNNTALIPHLFKTEFSKITSVLCKLFGFEHIEMAEDIVSDTFVAALETWPYKGIPENPTAWLYLVAKNKAKNILKHNQIFSAKIAQQIQMDYPEKERLEIDLSEKSIMDSQLQMLFAICNPIIPTESQIGLALRILCGFGIGEIANAFLTNKETINKRLLRAKERLKKEKIKIEFPEPNQINSRLDTVLSTLYLLFNEGYYSESQESIIREELCFEAIRLTEILINNSSTDLPKVNALSSLMNFHGSRLTARKDENGGIILFENQDESLWNQEMISRGGFFLQKASTGNQLSKYHLEASIAYWHTIKMDSEEKWENILQLYNHLLQIEYSPIAALNRTFALSKVKGKAPAIVEAEKLQLNQNSFYFALLGELYHSIDNIKAKKHLEKAYELTKSASEKNLILQKINGL